jgi:hypothetical protein
MPKPISEYTLRDWKRLRPLIHAFKTWRYHRVDRRYMPRPARAGDPAAIASGIAGRDVLVTIAFNDSEAIGWQTQLIRHYVPRVLHVIADNSSDETAAAAIAREAARGGLPYLRLPKNPWRGFSRSHGIALNWVWRNVLRPGAPRAFGFIDDDLFPMAPDDPFAALKSQDLFGSVRHAGERWFLWAGFCMFRFDAVKDKELDFGQDWFNGLDTGGGNWEVLYRYADRGALQEPRLASEPYKAGIALEDGPIDWCGAWLHEVGTMGNAALAVEKRGAVAELLAPHLRAAQRDAPTADSSDAEAR